MALLGGLGLAVVAAALWSYRTRDYRPTFSRAAGTLVTVRDSTLVGTASDGKALTDVIGDTLASRYLLGTAMAAVGLSTSFRVFRGVGLKPFAVGLAGAVVVGSVGMAMAILFGRFVTL